ncbi:hypothetical protein J2S30_000690 [Herbaspirillum rubrisubalbicans]|uniref:hypothetical protein n=1 Tax=Herbaspirillum rubrisubalbicans TaxID=80842 RepID=UPI00209C80F7|nr:hypothetical protein [Herbaspirillum rubrisubalbicans]MCP1572311.1 hypothetical protein [Herbaspirillum rubrisubalbicans]
MSKDEALRICVGSAMYLNAIFEDSKNEGVPLLQTALGRKLADTNAWFLVIGKAEILHKKGQTPLALSNQLLNNCMSSYDKDKIPALELW